MTRVAWTFCALVVLSASSAGRAAADDAAPQAPAPEAVTLSQALELVESQNPDMQAARLQVAQAEAQRVLARQLPNPTLGTTLGNIALSQTQPPGLSVSETIQTGIALGQPLILWGKRGLRIEGADAGIAAAHGQERDALRQLRAAVKDAYFRALRDDRALAFATENERRHRDVVALQARRFRSGDISEVDFRKIEVEGLRFLSDLEDARRSSAEDQNLLGRLVGADRPVTALGEPVAPVIPEDPDALIQQAQTHRPDLLALERSRAQAALALQVAKRERYPDVTVGATYLNDQWTRGGDMRNTIGLGLSVPLPLLNQNQGSIAQAEVALRQADTQLNRTRLDIVRDVRDALAAYRSARALREKYETGYLERSHVTLTGAEASYRAGAASLIDYLDAERTYTATQLNYLDTVLAMRVGTAAIELAVGEDFPPR
jgi:cobalt-zinc-cadmium efflux system outer membrane protein